MGVNRWLILGAIFALLAGGTPPAIGQPDLQVTQIEYTGQGAVPIKSSKLVVWQTAQHSFELTLQPGPNGGPHEICVWSGESANEQATKLECKTVPLTADRTRRVTVAVDNWPLERLGDQTITATVRNLTSDQPMASASRSITVIEREGDVDGDDLTNQEEVRIGTTYTVADTDRDGLTDGSEVRIFATDPLNRDSDGDGLPDGTEANILQTDPASSDSDGDGLPDGREVSDIGSNPNLADSDFDGLDDAAEVNTYNTNATVADTDGDGLPDGAEVREFRTNPTNEDTDGDGLSDGREVTVFDTDPIQSDTDGDGIDDRAEIASFGTNPTAADTDGDGIEDGMEINTHGTNPTSADTDLDGIPDLREVRRGSDPLEPTAGARRSVLRRVVTLAQSPMGLLVGGLAILAIGGLLLYYRSHRPRTGWLDPFRTVAGDGEAGQESEPIDPAIMTNEERVLHILRENDGRIMQSEIVNRVDWSKATVSRVLSDMETAGTVDRVDIGRGNLVIMADEEPPNTG